MIDSDASTMKTISARCAHGWPGFTSTAVEWVQLGISCEFVVAGVEGSSAGGVDTDELGGVNEPVFKTSARTTQTHVLCNFLQSYH